MSELIIRPLQPGETELFLSYPFPRVAALWETKRDYEALLAAREYRPEHTWIALRDGVVVARACWWAGPDDDLPAALDWLEAEPGPRQAELGTQLLVTAHEKMRDEDGNRPAYHLFLPPGWRDDPVVRPAAENRLQAAQGAGLQPFVERLGYRWSAEQDGLPKRGDRLEFRPADDAELVVALRKVLEGTFDAHDRRAIAEHGIDETARSQLKDLYWFPSPREWWQLAYTAGGELAGLIIPARNYSMPTIGYIGVVPEQRGNGYVDDLLAEMAWRLSELAPGEEVGADTDVDNVPMAKAFTRAGFRNTTVRFVLSDAGS
jgi:GNAT superfamily N-acetyltransferase/RimJ/RimL family protein N-acetyltransferase